MLNKSIRLLVSLCCLTVSFSSISGITGEDALHSSKAKQHENTLAYNGFSGPAEITPTESSSGRNVQTLFFSTGAETQSIVHKTLVPEYGWACALSKVTGFYGRGLKGLDVEVYKSGGYWHLKSGRGRCGGCALSAQAMCWQTN